MNNLRCLILSLEGSGRRLAKESTLSHLAASLARNVMIKITDKSGENVNFTDPVPSAPLLTTEELQCFTAIICHSRIECLLQKGSMMMANLNFTPVISLIFLAFPLSAAAQDFSIGQHEFMNSCAHCHGASGKGEGIIAGYLTEKVPDLTLIQKENDGVFPFARLYEVIDGTDSADVHGTREMPVWGDRYMRTPPGANVPLLGEYRTQRDQEIFARGRILALIEYISTLQEQ